MNGIIIVIFIPRKSKKQTKQINKQTQQKTNIPKHKQT
jgi:hypothetical protein